MTKQQEFREYTSSSELRIDRDKCLLRNVKVLGYESKNGRRYTESAARAAIDLYRGAPVNVNHTIAANDGRERPIEDRFGWLENVRHERDGIYADLRYLKTDPRAEKVTEIAEANPALIGLSHHAYGNGKAGKDGQMIVEQITRVKSVDLVCDPATTRGLFESEGFGMGEEQMAAGSGDMTWDVFVSEAKKVYDGEGDGAAKAKTVGALAKKLFKLAEELASVTKPAEEKPDMAAEDKAAEEAARKQDSSDVKALKEELAKIKTEAACKELLESVGVKADALKLKALASLGAEDRKALAETWKQTADSTRPRSSGPLFESQRGEREVKTSKDFVSLLSR